MTLLLTAVALAMACSIGSPESKLYEARFVPEARIAVDGVLDESAWKRAAVERGFTFPWLKRPAPATEFRALHDAEAFYFSFRVHDEDIVLVDDYREKLDVVREDRVELLFAGDEKLSEYFCLEMDPLGRTLDYKAAHYRKFDFPWSFPGVRVAGKLIEQGYVVEGSIRLASLRQLGFDNVDSGGPIKFGIFRAELSSGDGPKPIENWISWVDPRTEQPDFHLPSALGYLKLVR